MKLKKTLLVTGAASTIGLSSVVGMGVVSAQTPTNTNTSGGQGLVDKIATKFNLKTSDVQALFDENKAARQQEMQTRLETRLTTAVDNGKITSAQKDQILAKLREMRSFMETLKDKTPAERKTLMQQKRTELEQWAKDNNLSMDYLRPMGGGPKGPGGPETDDTTSQSSSISAN